MEALVSCSDWLVTFAENLLQVSEFGDDLIAQPQVFHQLLDPLFCSLCDVQLADEGNICPVRFYPSTSSLPLTGCLLLSSPASLRYCRSPNQELPAYA